MIHILDPWKFIVLSFTIFDFAYLINKIYLYKYAEKCPAEVFCIPPYFLVENMSVEKFQETFL